MQNSSKLIFLGILILAIFMIAMVGWEGEVVVGDAIEENFEGTYVGYSWMDEVEGVELDEAERKIETILTLNEDGIIEDVDIRYWQKYDGYWGTRNDDSADIWVNFAEEPTTAGFNEEGEYELGNSMFKISTNSLKSLWAVAVDNDGTVAAVMHDPWYRFMHEMKFEADFDFENATVGEDLTLGGDNFHPNWRAARDEEVDWEGDYGDDTIFDFIYWNHVMTARGTFEGMGSDTSVKELLEAMGVEFEDGEPVPMDVNYGYDSRGGWSGNYEAIAEYLIGRDATEVSNLYNPDDVLTGQSMPLSESINEDNEFGVDVPTGATRNVQDSFDTVSGATVRVSREATSYQRALVEAGILDEDEVILGRF